MLGRSALWADLRNDGAGEGAAEFATQVGKGREHQFLLWWISVDFFW